MAPKTPARRGGAGYALGMRRIVFLGAILLAGAVRAFAAPAAQARATEPDTCPCTRTGFVAQTDKARAAAAFWEARSHRRVARTASSLVLLGSLLSGNLNNPTLGDAVDADNRADARYDAARAQALQAGAVRFAANAQGEEEVYVLLEAGKDYIIQDGR